MADKHDLENFGMVLGLVKTVKLESMDASIKKSMELMHNTVEQLATTISELQETLVDLTAEGDKDSCKILSEKLADTVSVYNQVTETLCALLAQQIHSSIGIRENYSKVELQDLPDITNPEKDPS